MENPNKLAELRAEAARLEQEAQIARQRADAARIADQQRRAPIAARIETRRQLVDLFTKNVSRLAQHVRDVHELDEILRGYFATHGAVPERVHDFLARCCDSDKTPLLAAEGCLKFFHRQLAKQEVEIRQAEAEIVSLAKSEGVEDMIPTSFGQLPNWRAIVPAEESFARPVAAQPATVA